MRLPRSLSASAFLVNVSRARRVDISLDRFAGLWVTPESMSLWEDFAAQVYPFDDVELGLRNRFFLERFRLFVRGVQRPVCVNIAAGFTSYPFLVEEPCRWVEVDLEKVVKFKQRQVASWVHKGIVPSRNVSFLSADLRDAESRSRLQCQLQDMVGIDPSCILFEGISYYLDLGTLRALYAMCAAVQQPGSLLACDFWDHSLAGNPTFQRLTEFFSSRFGYDSSRYTFLEAAWFRHLPEYSVVAESDIQSLEREMLHTEVLGDSLRIIPEHYVVLKKQ